MRFALVCLALLPLACGKEEKPAPAATEVVTMKFADPGPSISVLEAKQKAAGDEVVVAGRVSNIVKGFITFNLVDDSLYYCGRDGAEDKCKTPWDYCCVASDERAAGTLTVEARDAAGKVRTDPMIPGVRLLDLVAVKGKVEKDEHGNVTIVATQWLTRERPELPGDLHWPE